MRQSARFRSINAFILCSVSLATLVVASGCGGTSVGTPGTGGPDEAADHSPTVMPDADLEELGATDANPRDVMDAADAFDGTWKEGAATCHLVGSFKECWTIECIDPPPATNCQGEPTGETAYCPAIPSCGLTICHSRRNPTRVGDKCCYENTYSEGC